MIIYVMIRLNNWKIKKAYKKHAVILGGKNAFCES